MRKALVCLLLLATACTSGTKPAPAGTAKAPSATPAAGVILAAEAGSTVVLYRVAADRRAVRLTTLRPPEPTENWQVKTNRARQIALSQGSSPTTCVLWDRDDTDGEGDNVLRCYRFGDIVGWEVVEADRQGVPVDFALAADAHSIAWLDQLDESGSETQLTTARLAEGQVTATSVVRVNSSDKPTADIGCNLAANLAWAGDRLLVECSGDNDYPGGLVLQAGGVGVQPAKVPDDTPGQEPYNYFTRAVSAEATTALAIQGEYCEIECPDKQPPASDRAVRVDLKSGKVLEVIATAEADRAMVSVSGGQRGVVYVTQGSSDQRTYLRLPGDKRGTRITGLPVGDVFAQP